MNLFCCEIIFFVEDFNDSGVSKSAVSCMTTSLYIVGDAAAADDDDDADDDIDDDIDDDGVRIFSSPDVATVAGVGGRIVIVVVGRGTIVLGRPSLYTLNTEYVLYL